MNRREFIQVSMGAALAAQAAVAQTPSASAPAATVAKPLTIDAYSRHLQWLRTADDVAEAVFEMGYTGLDITVMPGGGHVDPTKVAQDLPPFVNTIRKHGILVRTIRCPITDADSPNAEEILAAASALGITHYWGLGLRYEQGKPIMEQLDSFKPRVEKVAALNAKYKMTGMYHTYSGEGTVGAAIWDLLYLLKNFDPAQVGFHYDFGHMTNAGGNGTWALNLRAAGPYVAGLSVKDSLFERDINVADGGAYNGQPLGGFGAGAAGGRGPGGRGAGNAAPVGAAGAPPAGGNAVPGGPGVPPPAGAAAPGGAQGNSSAPAVGGGPLAQGGPGPAAAGPGGEGGPAGAGRGGRGGGRGRGGAGGPGGAAGGPAGGGRGGGGATNPWRVREVPLGEGMDDLPKLATVLKEINFSGPVEIQAEYSNGGAGNGATTITLPREQVLGAMKRDRLVLQAALGTTGLM